MENYFNYFTEIEECFRRRRGTPSLLSTVDWALIESWKEAGVPLEAALAGIEHSFEKFAGKHRRLRKINSLSYCSQSVLEAAEQMRAAQVEGGAGPGTKAEAAAPFANDEILEYFNRNSEAVERASRRARNNRQTVLAGDLCEAAGVLRELAERGSNPSADFEELEAQLSALEEKITASLIRGSSLDLVAQLRREAERGLAPYRANLSVPQTESLERQLLKRRLFEFYEVPRLSLFYLLT